MGDIRVTIEQTPQIAIGSIQMMIPHDVDWVNIANKPATLDAMFNNINYLDLDTTATSTDQVGRLKWNDTDGTADLVLKGGNVVLQVGQEQHIRVLNKTGSTLTEGTVVYITGAQGNRLTVVKAQASGETSSARTIGMLTEDIANNAEGFVTVSGLVRNINTSAYTEGAALWLSPTIAGGFTTTKPTAPNHGVLIGYCVKQHLTQGQIYVHVQNGYELEELHNVAINGVQTNDIIYFDGTVWRNTSVGNLPVITNILSRLSALEG